MGDLTGGLAESGLRERRIQTVYQVELKESYFPAHPGKALLAESIGKTLYLASLDSTEKTALAELSEDGSMGRQ